MHNGLGLSRVLGTRTGATQARSPYPFETGYIFPVDLGQRRESLVEKVPAIGQPSAGGEGSQGFPGEGGSKGDLAASRSHIRRGLLSLRRPNK